MKMAPLENLRLSKQLKSILLEIGETKAIKKGNFLFREGEKARNLFIVKSGLIKVGKLSKQGREISLRFCREGNFVGEISIYSDLTYILHAEVIEDSELIVIDKKFLEEKLLKESRLAIELIQYMNEMILRDQMRIYDIISHGKKGALYSTLIRLSNSYGRKKGADILIDIPLTNQEIANFCGQARESVNRSLNKLQKNKIITMDKGYITIKDLDYLRKEINCEQCPIVLCTIH